MERHNTLLFDEVIAKIEERPEEWDQTFWGSQLECGTTYCFAGWTAVLTGAQPLWRARSFGEVITPDGQHVSVSDYAQDQLGLTNSEAAILFHGTPTDLDRLKGTVKKILNGEMEDDPVDDYDISTDDEEF